MRVRGKHTFDKAPEIQGTTDKFVAVKETTIAPTVNDDNTQGYYVGYKWVNTTTDTTYHCEDATTGAAVWTAGGAATDADAIHDNVSGEINAVTEKVTPVSADLLLIEDSADSNNKKKAQVGNLPFNDNTVATDAIWDTAGDLVYGTGADTGAKLPIGTANQKLKVNAGATAPEWVTETDSIEIEITSAVTSGSATSGFLASTNNMNEYEMQGSGGGASKIVYYSFIVPANYKSGGSVKIGSWTTDFTNLTTLTATVNINGTVDSTVNAVSIVPTSDSTYETTTSTLGSSISSGDVMQLRINFTGSTGDDVRLNRITFEYNA